MTKAFKKFYPVAGKKSPYVILEPDEYSAMMSEECVRYSDSDLAKMKSFSRLAKYIIIAWCFAAVFILVQQTFYRETVILDQKSSSVIHKIQYYFGSSNQNLVNEELPTKCMPGVPYKPDSCNTCQCNQDGNPVACTRMACENPKDPVAVLF